MKTNRASDTAHAGAFIRALESTVPAQKRIADDQYAIQFVKPYLQTILRMCRRMPTLQRGLTWVLDRYFPTVVADFICRTAWIDAHIEQAVARGIDTLVIIGAGYDTRPLRLTCLTNCTVYEVDHPDTQVRKQALLGSSLRPSHQFIPVDLADQKELADCLPQFDKPVFFLLEGLLGYLTLTDVEKLFAQLAKMAPMGSEILFSYIQQSFIQQSTQTGYPKRMRKYLDDRGESFRSGLASETLPTFLASCHFQLLANINPLDYATEYLKPRQRQFTLFPIFGLAKAVRVEN
ncbi:SAM-dependent methyltransferase [Spirosoma sp. HMF4905]|uniref:S-adenosyl-L-methionine-dependent methyltransferase n=1 Tax=Spirosoma arboris TaxID=2682092 RepID=A0A7K1SLB0_9BACT|nr:SAM-dependent methyltransferase [Spirosoma arboris]MVM34600.1 SAM-dependent methyltransferase [Spirosoma arboris]